MITITRMVQTCSACPSQWDGWDADGVYYYFRYRWGHLEVTKNAFAEGESSVLSKDIGHGLDGCMTYDELRDHVSSVLALPATCEQG